MSATTSPITGSDPKRAISLLSFDAGGPQGISQLLILKDVMERLSNDERGDSQGIVKQPCEVFDMIGGVGTGRLIAIFLVVLGMTVKDALDGFNNFVVEVFKDVDHDPRKQTERLLETTSDILERHGIAKDTKLVATGQPASRCKLMVPVMYKNHVGSPCVLRNYISGHEPPVDLTIAEAMLATCSTPPIFTPMTISRDFATFEYVGGDSGLSNPTREVITEAHRTFGDERTVSCLLSIGCGHPGVNPIPSDSGGNARINFLERVALDSEKTAHEIATQMDQLTLYHRLSVQYGLERNQVQGWREPESIIAHTATYLNDLGVVELLDRCVTTIRHGDGFTTLEQLSESLGGSPSTFTFIVLEHSGGAQVLSPALPPLTPNYVERKAPMRFIEKALLKEDGRIKSGSKRITVTGIGGCGKTQLIRYLIEKYKHLFESTFFVDGSSPETIRHDIVRHVRALGGAHSQKSFAECMVFLSQALHGGQRLLVIDNVDDPTLDLSPFLPRWENGAVIVTSRNHSRGQLSPATHFQLDVMTVDESVELLVRGSGQQWPPAENEKALAVLVAEELGCHPIALVQAISYMYNTGCSPGNYVILLCTNRDRLLRDNPATGQVDMRYKTAFAAFDASYSILPPKARNVWHLLSFFQWQRFPVELITVAAQDGFSRPKRRLLARGGEFELGMACLKEMFYTSGRWDPLELQSILATLRSHSLITISVAENATLLQMHPLVHEWGHLRIAKQDLHRLEAAAVRLLCCGASKDNYSMMQYLSSHVEGLCSAPEHLHANNLASLASILSHSGLYDKAATLEGIAHGMVKRELGPNHPNTVTASANLAVAYSHLGRYAEAVELQTAEIRWQTQQRGPSDPRTIMATEDLAVSYHHLGRYAEAAELLTGALRQRKQVLATDHPDTIAASARLAATYSRLGRHAEAEKLQIGVLKQREKALGADHPDTIRASSGLENTYREMGRYAEVEKMDVEVLERRKKLLGVDNPRTIQASANLAITYYALGRYADAEELHSEVLKKRTTLWGERHPDTIESMLSLAKTYHATQRQSEASSLAQKALRTALDTLGDTHFLYQEISKFVAHLEKNPA